MILDAGLCRVGRLCNGPTPRGSLAETREYWYGELEVSSSPYDEEERVDAEEKRRIRIHQDRRITGLYGASIDGIRYEITRVYHGRDENSGECISDLTLRRVETGGQDDA